MAKRMTIFTRRIGVSWNVHAKGTPRWNPMKSGGSPSGVRHPPIFATRKIRKTMMCETCRRHALMRIKGRMSSIAAPVVPIQLAISVPTRRISAFVFGVPARRPSTMMPPAVAKRPNKSMMKGTKSSSTASRKRSSPSCQPYIYENGTRNATLQNRATHFSFFRHHRPFTKGTRATERSNATKGMILQRGSDIFTV